MRILFLMMSFFLSATAWLPAARAASVDNVQWKAIPAKMGVQVYQLKSDEKRVLTVLHSKLDKAQPKFTAESVRAEVAKLEDNSKFTNQMLGLDKWHITHYELADEKSGQTISIVGSYEQDGMPYTFHQILAFRGQDYSQAELAQPQAKAMSVSQVMKTLKEAVAP